MAPVKQETEVTCVQYVQYITVRVDIDVVSQSRIEGKTDMKC